MSSKKVLVVFGATGNQGGSVIRAFLCDPVTAQQFHIRAITRDPSKSAAAALDRKGVSVIKIHFALHLKDAYAVFSVTNFIELMNKESEIQQGKNVADIAKELNIQHLIWSSLPYVSKITNGKYTKVLHFDSKAIVEEHIREIGVPATFLLLGAFMSFTLSMLSPVPSTMSGHSYKLALPIPKNTKWPMISAELDIGKYVRAILLNRDKVLGKQICAAERDYTLEEIVQSMRDKGGLDVTYEQIMEEQFRKGLEAKGYPDFFRDDLTKAMKYSADYGFLRGVGVGLEVGHQIVGERLENYGEWIAASTKPIEMR
ncbi:hypothetical protein F5884DRAFT_847621 [Xylogone sp. PMI_703]|nr:hypothetical protein F5884DRAFT_847621 [Xylogone sp. PMI_703]